MTNAGLGALLGRFAAAHFELVVGDHLQEFGAIPQTERSDQRVNVTQPILGLFLAKIEGNGLGLFALFLVHALIVCCLARRVNQDDNTASISLICDLYRSDYNLYRSDSTSDLNAKVPRQRDFLRGNAEVFTHRWVALPTLLTHSRSHRSNW